MFGNQIMAQLGDAIPADARDQLAAAADAMPLPQLLGIVSSAMRARQLLDSGDRDGALEIIAPYAQMARDAGLGAVWDQLAASLGTGCD